MTLSEYIAKIGNRKFAALYGCSLGTAKAYRYGLRMPHPTRAMRIIALTGGAVDWAGIYPENNNPDDAQSAAFVAENNS